MKMVGQEVSRHIFHLKVQDLKKVHSILCSMANRNSVAKNEPIFVINLPFSLLFINLPSNWGFPFLALTAFFLSSSTPVNILMGQQIAPNNASFMSAVMMGLGWGIGGLIMTPIGYFADLIGETGRVHSFEFCENNLNIFRVNLELNPILSSRIKIVENALFNNSGELLNYQQNGPSTHFDTSNNKAVKQVRTIIRRISNRLRHLS